MKFLSKTLVNVNVNQLKSAGCHFLWSTSTSTATFFSVDSMQPFSSHSYERRRAVFKMKQTWELNFQICFGGRDRGLNVVTRPVFQSKNTHPLIYCVKNVSVSLQYNKVGSKIGIWQGAVRARVKGQIYIKMTKN